ncbi:MAG: hypothetical protein CMJ18_27745, partial [Phycisphaeraceae bacterium]|nr:hypothetical protein [Phycisphaeraceae bacterium]
MSPLMVDKLGTIVPEITLGTGAVVCLMLGLAKHWLLRRIVPAIAALTLIIAALLVGDDATAGAGLASSSFVRLAILLVGLLLLMVTAAVPGQLRMTQRAEDRDLQGRSFEPGDVVSGEFFAFFLFSLTGAMLCASANDLVWLFLALELTSLPTYVLVATTRDRVDAQESGVKYFFLGALAAAVFLYGFSLIYGATGTTVFLAADGAPSIASYVTDCDDRGVPVSPLFVTGVVLALVGMAFKIAAFPMHAYAADVYQGAALPVTAMLAFVPKTAGFVAMIVLLVAVGWPLPDPVLWLLVIMAAVTMTVGNVMGLLQRSLKRLMAYSSIAHSGYMLVGVAAGPNLAAKSSDALGQGLAAVLFYLVAYGLATVGVFAVLGSLRGRGDEADTFDDLAGLSTRHPVLSAVLLL